MLIVIYLYHQMKEEDTMKSYEVLSNGKHHSYEKGYTTAQKVAIDLSKRTGRNVCFIDLDTGEVMEIYENGEKWEG